MTDTTLKAMIRETLEPMFNELVELNFKIYSSINKSLSGEMPEDQKLNLIKGILKNHSDVMVQSIKNSVPSDLDTKLKEAINGRSGS